MENVIEAHETWRASGRSGPAGIPGFENWSKKDPASHAETGS